VRNILLLFLKDFKRKWKNPVVIIGFMLIPFLFTFIFGMVFGSSEEEALPQVKVLAVDQDQSFLSEFLLTALTQGELKNMIDIRKVDEDEGRALLDRGKASALILIPENFGADVWEGVPREILLLKNPSEQFLPQIVEEITDVATLLFSSLFSVFSGELTTIKRFIDDGEVPDADISSLSIRLKERVKGISKYVFPPVISIKQITIKDEDEPDGTGITVYNYILPAMAIMFLLFICNVVFEDVLKEKEQGTLLRLSVSPMRLSEFVWSKILTSALIGMICTSALILLGNFVYSISWGHPLLVAAIIICLNILLAGFIALLYSFVKTERQAGALSSSVIIVMALLGGSMMPVENFPPLIQKFSKLTVNYWGLEAFKMAILREPLRKVLPVMTGMAAAGIILAFVSSYFLQKKLRKGLLK